MNLPNQLTIIRVCLIPVYIILILMRPLGDWSKYVAVSVFVLACITDFFDGYIARKRNLVTNFGKFMDPLADKLLVCSALVCLVHFYPDNIFLVCIVIVIVAREFIISGFRLVAAEQGVVIAASKLAKIKTNVQMYMIVLLVLDFNRCPFCKILEPILMWAALLFTVASLIEYLYKNRHVMKGQM